jgi:hypothetical protein
MSIQHVNVDTLVTWVAAVPDSLEAQLLSRRGWGYDSAWVKLAPFAVARRYPQHTVPDRPMVASLPVGGVTSSIAPAPTLFAVRMNGGGATPPFPNFGGPIALVQVTDLAVHARVGVMAGQGKAPPSSCTTRAVSFSLRGVPMRRVSRGWRDGIRRDPIQSRMDSSRGTDSTDLSKLH